MNSPTTGAKRTVHTETGQVLIIVALALVALVTMLALVVDGGNLYLQRRHMQNAADAAALAAAYRLGDGWSDDTIQSTVIEYAITRNDADAAQAVYLSSKQTVGGGYVPAESTGVRVHATRSVSSFFAGIIGMQKMTVAANAAAQFEERNNGCGGYVVWGHGTDCKVTMDWSGSGGQLTGNVHSNGSVKVSGSAHIIDGICEYVTTVQDNGSGITFVQVDAADDYPIWWDVEDYRPGGRAADEAVEDGKYFVHDCATWHIASSEHTIAEGLHYCHGDVKISGSSQYGHITVVAEGRIDVSNSDGNYEYYCDGLLFFSNEHPSTALQCGTNVVSVQGSGGSFTGFTFAPYGAIKYSGSSNHTVNGGLIGYTVDVSGTDFEVAYDDDICGDLTRKVIVRMIQ